MKLMIRYRLVLGLRLHINIVTRMQCVLHFMVTERLIRDKYLKHTILLSCGPFLSPLYVRTTITGWELVLPGIKSVNFSAAASVTYYKRGDYIPGIRVNGMDVLAVREACRFVRKWTLEGNGPIVMEMMTYRYGGHSMSDPGTTYRTREEIQQMRSKSDAINMIRHRIIESEMATEAELKAIDKSVRTAIDAAVVESVAAPEPALDQLYTDVYVKGHEVPYLRGTTAHNGQAF